MAVHFTYILARVPQTGHAIRVWSLLFLAFVLVACSDGDGLNKNNKQNEKAHRNQHAHAFEKDMDQATVEKLAKRFESPGRDSIERPDKVLQFIGDVQKKTLMDIGAGTGYYSVKFANNGANVIAADVSDSFQRFLAQRITNEKIDNIKLRKVAHDNPMLSDKEADIVFIANTYHHIDDREKYFTKVKHGINEDGMLVVLDFFSSYIPTNVTAPPQDMRVSIDQVVFELRKAGFTSFEVDASSLPYHYMIKAK